LYWALLGGGPGKFGIVLSMTVRLYPDAPTSTSTLNFAMDANTSLDDYWNVIETFMQRITPLNDIGAHALAIYNNQFFTLRHALGHGVTAQQLDQELKPVIDALEHSGIKYSQ
jgi:FAD/FMN-containing dehydrogenase